MDAMRFVDGEHSIIIIVERADKFYPFHRDHPNARLETLVLNVDPNLVYNEGERHG